jgi:hypothetical protein
MTDRQFLGWVALAAIIVGPALAALLWASCVALGITAGGTDAGTVAVAFAALLAATGGVLGAFAWRTGPGKAAVIVCLILLAAGVVAFAGLMYIAWLFSRMG